MSFAIGSYGWLTPALQPRRRRVASTRRRLQALVGRRAHALESKHDLVLGLPSAQAEKLRHEAQRLGVAPEDLARAAVFDLLSASDAEFRTAAARVLQKNQELYRRLA